MSDSDNQPIKWDFKLDFNLHAAKPEAPPPPPEKIPPRTILQEKFPHLLDRIEILWGTIELHHYLERTLTTDRSDRQGFSQDVIQALSELHLEHRNVLKAKGVLSEDLWDKNYKL